MQVLQELGLAYTMLSGAVAHVMVAFHLIKTSKVAKVLKELESQVGK